MRLAAAGHGALLVVDDLHEADEGSLRLLHYLARCAVRSGCCSCWRTGPTPTPRRVRSWTAWWPAVSAACWSCGRWTTRHAPARRTAVPLAGPADAPEDLRRSARAAVHRAGVGAAPPRAGTRRRSTPHCPSLSSGPSSGSRCSARRSPPTSCWPWRGCPRRWPTGTSTPPSAPWWWSPRTRDTGSGTRWCVSALIGAMPPRERSARRGERRRAARRAAAPPGPGGAPASGRGPACTRRTVRASCGGDRPARWARTATRWPWWTRCAATPGEDLPRLLARRGDLLMALGDPEAVAAYLAAVPVTTGTEHRLVRARLARAAVLRGRARDRRRAHWPG